MATYNSKSAATFANWKAPTGFVEVEGEAFPYVLMPGTVALSGMPFTAIYKNAPGVKHRVDRTYWGFKAEAQKLSLVIHESDAGCIYVGKLEVAENSVPPAAQLVKAFPFEAPSTGLLVPRHRVEWGSLETSAAGRPVIKQHGPGALRFVKDGTLIATAFGASADAPAPSMYFVPTGSLDKEHYSALSASCSATITSDQIFTVAAQGRDILPTWDPQTEKFSCTIDSGDHLTKYSIAYSQDSTFEREHYNTAKGRARESIASVSGSSGAAVSADAPSVLTTKMVLEMKNQLELIAELLAARAAAE